VAVSVAALLSFAASGRAHAFGGLWSSQTVPVRPSAEEIIFVDNPDSTVTAIVQMKYAGPAQRFAWLIPLPSKPRVGVSSNTVFRRLDAATAPEYWVEVAVEGECKQKDQPRAAVHAGPGAGAGSSAHDSALAPLAVAEQGSVGPYEYANLAVDRTLRDPTKVATDWLAANGYDLPILDTHELRPYLNSGFHLLAFKLRSDAEAGAIRPVILTYESQRPMIPIRPAALSAQDDMGIRVWVIGPSQAVPDNYASLVIDDARIDWLTGRKYVAGTLPSGGVGPFDPDHVGRPSNYDVVVTAAAREAGGHAFVTELGAPASHYRDKVWSSQDDQQFAAISSQKYADGLDAILNASHYYRGWDGWREAVAGATTLPAGVSVDEFGRNPERYRGVARVDTSKFLRLLDEDVIRPVADTAAMLYQAPYLTRLYGTMSSGDMRIDPSFDYNADLALVGNVHVAKELVQCSPSLRQDAAPWRIELPQGGLITGRGSGGWPVEEGTLPANLKVVQLSTAGPGTVVSDNSDVIGRGLLQIAETTGGRIARSLPWQRLGHHSPKNGVMIGTTQSVTPYGHSSAPQVEPNAPSGARCSVSEVGADVGPAFAPWLATAGGILALRRRRQRRGGGRVRRGRTKRYASWKWTFFLVAGCSRGGDAPAQGDAGVSVAAGTFTRAQLLDPETCKVCHPIHYREWSSSMHAYSAKDPVFVAMNKRGQRETHGELGDFCIRCHAPMAVLDNLTKDGLDLERLPDKERGVSCYFCHNVIGIEGEHNAMLRLANDTTMRGPIRDPVQPGVHRAQYSEMFEDTSAKSTAMCGGCHDILTRTGVHLERTFEEYRAGLFSKSATGAPPAFDSCVGCHMPNRKAFAAIAPKGVGPRAVHEHLWPGIDLPLGDFPHRDALRSAVEDCQLGQASVSFFTLEFTPPDLFSFEIETKAGHHQPSGASQDRRMWLEFLAYDESGKLLEQVSSGNIADGEVEEKPEDDPKRDSRLLMLRDRIYDAQGRPVHMFWQAAMSSAHPDGYESNVMPVATTSYVDGTHVLLKQYRASGPHGLPARVTARLRVRPIGLDILQDLVASGDLDPSVAAKMATLNFGAKIEWAPGDGLMKTVSANPRADCKTYRCLLDPTSQFCQ
jgi:hypothetical protein